MLLSEEHIKERRKERKWVPSWIWKRYSKGAYYLIINDLSLVDKEDSWKYLQMNTLTAIPILLFYLNKIVFLHFFCTSRNYLSKSSLQLMLVSVFVSWNSENKRTCSAQVQLYCVLLKKNNFCIMNKIKLVWKKNYTMLHLKIFLEYWKIMYIFRILV